MSRLRKESTKETVQDTPPLTAPIAQHSETTNILGGYTTNIEIFEPTTPTLPNCTDTVQVGATLNKTPNFIQPERDASDNRTSLTAL